MLIKPLKRALSVFLFSFLSMLPQQIIGVLKRDWDSPVNATHCSQSIDQSERQIGRGDMTSRSTSSFGRQRRQGRETKGNQRGGGGGGGGGGRSVESCPSFRSGHLPDRSDLERLRNLTAPHVESFNYLLEHGLAAGIEDIEPAELSIVDPRKQRDGTPTTTTPTIHHQNNDFSVVKFWFENVRVSKPSKEDQSMDLFPRECRERRLMYAGTIRALFCYTTIQRRNGMDFPGKPVRIPKEFGALPIMVLSNACHLQGTSPKELVKLKEEVRTIVKSYCCCGYTCGCWMYPQIADD